tara:strand:+ start:989 stop:1162 length:174 start_codon:yes stop_codon:yes gene_type:complete
MTTTEIKNQLTAIKNTLSYMLVEGDKKGKEISHAYEAGLYIGTIKATIQELEYMLGK